MLKPDGGTYLWGHHFENKEAVGTTPRANRRCRAVNQIITQAVSVLPCLSTTYKKACQSWVAFISLILADGLCVCVYMQSDCSCYNFCWFSAAAQRGCIYSLRMGSQMQPQYGFVFEEASTCRFEFQLGRATVFANIESCVHEGCMHYELYDKIGKCITWWWCSNQLSANQGHSDVFFLCNWACYLML